MQLFIPGPAHPLIILSDLPLQSRETAMLTSLTVAQTCCVYTAGTSHTLHPLLGKTCPSNTTIMMTHRSGLSSGKPSSRKPFLIHPLAVWAHCHLGSNKALQLPLSWQLTTLCFNCRSLSCLSTPLQQELCIYSALYPSRI